MSIEYLAWRCTWQSAESAARAAWENSEDLYKQLQAANQRIPESEYDEFYHAMVEKPEQQAASPETVLEMLEVSLSAAGFGGLYVDGICGCKLGELSPTVCLNTECTPGYLHVRSDGEAWVICSEQKPLSDQEIDGVADSC